MNDSQPVSLVDSLLTSIVRADGDALVLHVGERPFVVSPAGPVELSARNLTVDSVVGMLSELVPADRLATLEADGAVEHEVRRDDTGERFVLVAARGGDDIWVEIRRHRAVAAAGVAPAAAEARPGPTGRDELERLPVGRAAVWPPTIPEPAPAVVVPLRGAGRAEAPAGAGGRSTGLVRLLRLAASQGATSLFVAGESRPLARLDGEVVPLEGEGALSAADVEALLLDLAPEPSRDALRSGVETEWISEVPEVGRVRCLTFRDHRGSGGIFHLMPARIVSADQLGLSREIQALAGHLDGFILVSGRRASGKSTLVSAFVDLINRTRADHVITLESQIKFVHQSRRAFVSQREVRGDSVEMATMARAALREDPDALVIDDLRSASLTTVALEAADAGRLVIGSIPAASATEAVERIIDQFPAPGRSGVQLALARSLRGIVVQALLGKAGGGRLAARELLLNTPPVAKLIAEGKTFQLPFALESGRKDGMVPLNDALAAFVQSGATDAREAYRKAADRDGLLTLLKRAGVDTSFVERLA